MVLHPALNEQSDLAGLMRQLVDAWGSWAPSVSPDSDHVAFVSDRSGRPEVWVQAMASGPAPDLADAVRVPVSPDPVVSVHWSSDGEWLACAVAAHGGVRTEVWVVRPDGSQLQRIAGSAEHHATLGPWTRHGRQVVITNIPGKAGDSSAELVDPATGEHEPLAVGALVDVLDLSAGERFALLRDGKRGAQFCVVLDRELDSDHPLLPYPQTGSTSAGMLRPAPYGDETAMVAYLVSDAGQPRKALLAIPIHADGERGEVGLLAAREDGELDFVDADDAGREMVLVWNVQGRSEVELLDVESGRRTPLPDLPGAVVDGCVLSRDGSCVVLCVQSPTRPQEIWRLDLGSLTWHQVSDRPPLPDASLVTPTLQHFLAHDGLPLSGWLYRAVGPQQAGPAMLSLHGGPESQERPTFSAQHQALAAAGISVFAPNIRGSSGYGRAFVHADDRHGRHDAITDVETSALYLVGIGVANGRRIAVTGRSYGGYLTLAALARFSGLFAAGVDICGMSDLMTFYRDTEPWIAAAAVTKYGDPKTDGALLRQISPINHVRRIIAPVLVVHGELDTNVPLNEATQIVAALRALGRDVEYLELAGEGHEYRLPSSRLQLIETMARFLTLRLAVDR
ncbi:Dipeptidyl aminopeptidase/acylaminoacyl peptidase [Frankineae bacterium MT45]|nr:Dipeptidyl aminopeptidase/acylaminoacyl peptidase [Frankineae bacterium MT45]